MLAGAGSGCQYERTQAACFRAAWGEAACPGDYFMKKSVGPRSV
jgi:hypothetical protein